MASGERSSETDRPGLLVLVAAVLVFGLAGLGITLSHPDRGSLAWQVWAVLATALATAAGVTFLSGLFAWRSLCGSVDVSRAAVRMRVLALGGLFVVLGLVGVAAGSSWRGIALTLGAVVGGGPSATVMFGMATARDLRSRTGTAGQLAVALQALRRLLLRQLSAVGALVALSTLALGSTADLPSASTPPSLTVIFGGCGSALIALIYVPAALRLREWARELSDRLFSVDQIDDGDGLLSRLSRRHELEGLLVGAGVLADMQTRVLILAPLLSSAATLFL